MNMNGDAAEQVLRMSLEGTETALKITGAGAEKIGKLLYKLLRDLAKETKKTRGQMRLTNMIRSGKKLEIFEIPDANLRKFCELSKNYGVVYTILKDKSLGDGKTEIMVKTEDSQKINHILSRMEIAVTNTGTVETDADKVIAEHEAKKEVTKTETVRTETVKTETVKTDTAAVAEKKDEIVIPAAVVSEGHTPPEIAAQDKALNEKFAAEIFDTKSTAREEAQTQNPTEARNAKSRQSVPSSTVREGSATRESSEGRTVDSGRTSVRRELKDYREQIRRAEEGRSTTRARTDNSHKAPARKRKPKETGR